MLTTREIHTGPAQASPTKLLGNSVVANLPYVFYHKKVITFFYYRPTNQKTLKRRKPWISPRNTAERNVNLF